MYNKIVLPYDFNSLEPYIDAKTLEIHYCKHLQGYVNKLNKTLRGYEEYYEGKTLEELLKSVCDLPEEIRQSVINNGGGVYNHNLYFANLSPTPCKIPSGKLLDKINDTFGNLDTLIKTISKAAVSKFGSGYGSLVMDDNKNLFVVSTSNQDTTLESNLIPILTIDVWEHAYYLKYQNLRADYVDNIWNVVDWCKVEMLYNR